MYNNQANNRQFAPRGAGRGRGAPRQYNARPRDVERMYQYNLRHAIQNNDWSDEVEQEARFAGRQNPNYNNPNRGRGGRPPTRRGNQGKDKKKEEDEEGVSKTSTPPLDEAKFDGSALGSVPTQNRNCHNLDFSGFPQLVQQTYETMATRDDRFRRRMPFCLYNYYLTVLLNTKLMYVLQSENGDITLRAEGDLNFILDEFVVPEPIEQYFNSMNSSNHLTDL